MFAKALIITGIVALINVQFATSLSCYTCVNPNDCRNPSKQTCSNATANSTSYQLGIYHNYVRELNSVRFNCLSLRYTYPNNNSISHQLHGCIHPDVGPCDLQLKPQFSNWRRTKCEVCSGDNCNKNPAGKMSSSVYTIAATVLGLVLAKIYA